MRKIHETVCLHRIGAVEGVALEQLLAEPTLRCGPPIVDAINRRETESPIDVIGLHRIRDALNPKHGLVHFQLVGNDRVGLRNVGVF